MYDIIFKKKVGIIMKKYLYVFLFALILLCGCTNNKENNDNKEKEVEKISITFVGDGIEDNEVYVEKGSTYDLPIPERNGYTFLGWKDMDTNEIVDNTYIFNEDTFLEASWNKKTMHIIYYKYGNATLKDESFYEEDAYELYQPEIEGYTFEGWFADEKLTKQLKEYPIRYFALQVSFHFLSFLLTTPAKRTIYYLNIVYLLKRIDVTCFLMIVWWFK